MTTYQLIQLLVITPIECQLNNNLQIKFALLIN